MWNTIRWVASTCVATVVVLCGAGLAALAMLAGIAIKLIAGVVFLVGMLSMAVKETIDDKSPKD